MTIIQQVFSPWAAVTTNVTKLVRISGNYSVTVDLKTYEVSIFGNAAPLTKSGLGSLTRAIEYADAYIEQNFAEAQVLQKRLDESQQRVKELEEKIRNLELEKALSSSRPSLEPKGWPIPKPEDFYKTDAVGTLTVNTAPDTESKYLRDTEDIPF